MPGDYQVYVLRNPDGRFYIGLTEDLRHRVEQHNGGHSKWTRSNVPWQLAWQSTSLSLSSARKLENKLKRQKGGGGFFRLTGITRTVSS